MTLRTTLSSAVAISFEPNAVSADARADAAKLSVTYFDPGETPIRSVGTPSRGTRYQSHICRHFGPSPGGTPRNSLSWDGTQFRPKCLNLSWRGCPNKWTICFPDPGSDPPRLAVHSLAILVTIPLLDHPSRTEQPPRGSHDTRRNVAKVTSRNQSIELAGELPAVGLPAPDFRLTGTDLQDKTLRDYAGKKVILNIFPSIDTPVCATSTKKFDSVAKDLGNVVILCVSADLPFAHGRFCKTEGLSQVVPLSSLRDYDFGTRYGVRLMEGALAGLFARAVVVLDENGRVIYTELVPDISDEPDYESALTAVRYQDSK